MRKGRLILMIIGIIVIVGIEVLVLSHCAKSVTENLEPEATPTPTPILLSPSGTVTPAPTPTAVLASTPTPEPSAAASGEEPAEAAEDAETEDEEDADAEDEDEEDADAEEEKEDESKSASDDPSTNGPQPTSIPTFNESTEYGTLLNSGNFSSDTGTTLNLNVFWAVYDNGGDDVQIYLVGTLSSGNVEHGPHSYGATITYGDLTASAATQTVIVTNGFTESDLFETVITVPKGTADYMSVAYDYGGTYSGQSLPTITAVGYVLADSPDNAGTEQFTSAHD